MSDDAKTIIEIESGGLLIEAAGGIAVIVLAIIGLARGDDSFLTSIATIVLGVALLAEGGAIAAQFSKLSAAGGMIGTAELGGGMTAEVHAGVAAIVLGILGLVGLHPMVLLPAAVIAVGGSLYLTAGAVERLGHLRLQAKGVSETAEKVAQAAVSGAAGTQILAGIAAIALGVLALVSASHTAILTLVALLVLGSALTLSGTAVAGRLVRMFAA